MSELKVCIFGGRDFTSYVKAITSVREVLSKYPIGIKIIIIGGKAPGADTVGEQIARDYDLEFRAFPADWNKHGKSAGPIRNREMAVECDIGIGFYDGKSRGTGNMISTMNKLGKPCYVFKY